MFRKKKKLVTLTTLVLICLGIYGCTESQIKVFSKQTGFYSAVGWITVDNPSVEQKNIVIEITSLIQTNAYKVQEGYTYSEVLQPIVDEYIEANVKENYKLLSSSGSVAILGGIDMLFASKPEWAEREDLVVSIVNLYCTGVLDALGRPSSDPIIKAASRQYLARQKVFVSDGTL